MGKRSLFVLAGICSLTIGGCGTADETASTPSPSSPAPVAQGSPTASPKAAQPFAAAPLVAAKDKTKTAAKDKDKTSRVPGLVQATDPRQRAKEVQAGINSRQDRKDPFASLPPLITLRTPSGAVGLPVPDQDLVVGSPAGAPGARRPTAIPNFPRNVATGSPGSRPTSARANPPNIIPALPPLPEPTLARAVEVTGVIVVAGVPQAIVKAPNESTSRYVQAGQRLSNGQVLVKRIEVNSGSEPIVILEQNGVEVGRAVGDKATPTPGTGRAAFAPEQSGGIRG
jgi:hypothetical protein